MKGGWLSIWIQTLFGRRSDQHLPADPDLERARQIKRDQENRLQLIEREIEFYRVASQHPRD